MIVPPPAKKPDHKVAGKHPLNGRRSQSEIPASPGPILKNTSEDEILAVISEKGSASRYETLPLCIAREEDAGRLWRVWHAHLGGASPLLPAAGVDVVSPGFPFVFL